jgi:hypothetical protein
MPTTDDINDGEDKQDERDKAEKWAAFEVSTRRKIANLMLRSALLRARRLNAGVSRPRRPRLPAQARALRSVVREAQVAGLVPMPEARARPRPSRRRRASPLSSRKP